MSNMQVLEQLDNLENKQDFKCVVRGYQYGHSHMYIWVANQKAKKRFFIYLEDVKYFCCPITWDGLHVSVGSKSECWGKLVKARIFADDNDLKGKSHQTLFKFDIGGNFAEVIASHIEIQESR